MIRCIISVLNREQIIIYVIYATPLVILRVVLKGTFPKKINVLSYGQNHYLCDTNKASIHAEHDAINKLPFCRKKIDINMLIIKFTNDKQMKLTMSKPCNKCRNMMTSLFPKKGYNIKNIYYSDQNGEIVKSTLNKLI